VGLNEIRAVTGFRVYPNPAQEKIIIENISPGLRTFVLYDVQGRQVQQLNVREGARLLMDLSRLPSGIYLLHSGNESIKIMLQGH
ncbi:MAG: Secretion system C-terminal sorting domain, partial [Bacteroidota bacterium]